MSLAGSTRRPLPAARSAVRPFGAKAKALQFNMRLSEEERARLTRVAKHYGLDDADVIRLLLRLADRDPPKLGLSL